MYNYGKIPIYPPKSYPFVLCDGHADIGSADAAGEDALQVVLLKDTVDDLHGADSQQTGGWATLPDEAVTGNQSQSQVPAHHSVREVKGGNHTHDTQRVPALHHEVVGTLGRDDLSVNGTRKSACEVTDVDGLLNLKLVLRKGTHKFIMTNF